jgi:hypothetical protein
MNGLFLPMIGLFGRFDRVICFVSSIFFNGKGKYSEACTSGVCPQLGFYESDYFIHCFISFLKHWGQ